MTATQAAVQEAPPSLTSERSHSTARAHQEVLLPKLQCRGQRAPWVFPQAPLQSICTHERSFVLELRPLPAHSTDGTVACRALLRRGPWSARKFRMQMGSCPIHLPDLRRSCRSSLELFFQDDSGKGSARGILCPTHRKVFMLELSLRTCANVPHKTKFESHRS